MGTKNDQPNESNLDVRVGDSWASFEPWIPGAERGSDEPGLGLVSGEAGLWTAVLELAVRELTSSPSAYRRLRAKEWIEADAIHIGSYLWTCDHLKLEPLKLRKMILAREATALTSAPIAFPRSMTRREGSRRGKSPS